MRDRVVVQVDGQLKTGRDVIIGALLGAEEFGFATAPLVVSGCIMMRACHLDTCPVGVATQNPLLRSRFTGKPEFVINFMEFIAEEVREHLAALGFRSLDEIIGHTELLRADAVIRHGKASGLDLSPILDGPAFPAGEPRKSGRTQDHELHRHFDTTLIALCGDALEHGDPVRIDLPIHNTERAVGTMLGHHVTAKYGGAGLPPETIDITLRGTAGQSLGAFLPSGITLRLEGDANDYVGKGLSGGDIVIRPPRDANFEPESNVIAGNVIGYGATSGSLFISGVVGERFLVRNSGATAVVEGVGDHALEYMTGGVAVILGTSGRNIGAGMSGGVAFVRNLQESQLNTAALASGELLLSAPDAEDVELLARLLTEHAERTGSALASALLADADALSTAFVKVLPRDYAAVQKLRSDARTAGENPDGEEIWTRILEATRG
jgi:glutamate synthase (NADPH/NADH) large chain